jgi:hypothetical protein
MWGSGTRISAGVFDRRIRGLGLRIFREDRVANSAVRRSECRGVVRDLEVGFGVEGWSEVLGLSEVLGFGEVLGLGEAPRDMRVEVECYAGQKADERPVRFRLEGHEYMVEEVLDQWYGPEDVFFKIRADDDNLYILRHETSVPDGDWELVSFRESGERR